MYTEKQLVSFGNYLFKRYGVQVYSTDGTNTPLYPREVSHADTSNWETSTLVGPGFEKGAKVSVQFRPNDEPQPAEVVAVHFYGETVKYDLSLQIGENQYTRIYNVESGFVKEPMCPEPVEV